MNEIQLLEQFRDDVPEPSTHAWMHARAALSAAMQEEHADHRGIEPVGSLPHGQRRSSRWRTASVGLGGAAAAAALAIGLAGPGSTSLHRSTATTRPTSSTGSMRTVGFVLTANTNGTLSLTMSEMLDPAALQRALEQHGIPAMVKTDTNCSSNPAAPDPSTIGVLTTQPPLQSAHGLVPVPNGSPTKALPPPGDTQTVINPAAIPAGTELFFDYAPGDNLISATLVYSHAYTCTPGTQFRPEPKS